MSNQTRGAQIAVAAATLFAGFAIAAIMALSCGLPFAVADNSAEASDSFGIGKTTSSTTSRIGVLSESAQQTQDVQGFTATSDASILSNGINYDVMVGVYQIEAAREAERLAAEEAARIDELEHIQKALQNKDAWLATGDKGLQSVEGLSEVNWEAGKQAFLDEWTERIDAYLARTHLAGYGAVFALAAWENGVDPRFSPAISNTESGNGAICFLPHNAWGWGSSSWSSWSQAISDHVAGLASGYGYSLTYSGASKYCPPNTDHWFNNTLGQMARI